MFPETQLLQAAHDTAFMEQLLSLLSENRRTLFERALENRTRHVCAVIENVEDGHNTSAVIRSCECLGIQDVHVISDVGFRTSKRILIGSGKWVDIHRYSEKNSDNTLRCINGLKEKGYRIVVTRPGEGALPVTELPLDRPVAICFGHERSGISKKLNDLADESITIPMYGFTESFNISVAAGIIFSCLAQRLRNSGTDWRLPEQEKKLIRLKWALRSVKKPEVLLRSFLNGRTIGQPG